MREVLAAAREGCVFVGRAGRGRAASLIGEVRVGSRTHSEGRLLWNGTAIVTDANTPGRGHLSG
jgi:hypothetical protein